MARCVALILLLCGAALAAPIDTRWAVAGSLRPPTRVLELTDAPTNGAFPLSVSPPVRYAAFNLAGRRMLVAVSPQMLWFDRLMFLVRPLDYLLPLPGMSLIAVGRKGKSPQG